MRHYQKTNISTIHTGKNGMIVIGDEESQTQEFIQISLCFQLMVTLQFLIELHFKNVILSI
jgi:hypothetical protein